MNITQAQKQAIRDNAADSAEFDLVTKGGRARCRWEDADMGILKILSGTKRLVGQVFHVSAFENDDGFMVENYEVPRVTVNVTDVETVPLTISTDAADYVIHDSKWQRVAAFPKTPQGREQAELIVRAVNAHDALVDALHGLLGLASLNEMRADIQSNHRVQAARAALALAEGFQS